MARPPGSAESRPPVLRIALLAVLAVLTHGYHLGTDDAGIYIPAIKKVADPKLYPFAAEFFQGHAHYSLFPELIGYSSAFTTIPVDWVVFGWHCLCILLLLIACWKLMAACFENAPARWCGVALLAALLTVPVAGTAIVIMDPYLTARSLSTPLTLFALSFYLTQKVKHAIACVLLAALVHPIMGVFAVGLCATLLVNSALARRSGARARAVIAFGFGLVALQPVGGIYHDILLSRPYLFVSHWMWYEWLGAIAPLAILWTLARVQPRGTTARFQQVNRAVLPFALLFTAAGMLIASSERLQAFARFQPMRAFQVVYIVLFAMLGGLLGEYVLRSRIWRWAALFLPLVLSMWMVQEDAFSNSPHVEWPAAVSANPWTMAFLWIRLNTPKDAVFALDPNYINEKGEDTEGFRAIAERSALADFGKDGGVVAVFPQLAEHWKEQVEAEREWKTFAKVDFTALARRFPVRWILTLRPAPAGLVCPYQNDKLTVCRISAL